MRGLGTFAALAWAAILSAAICGAAGQNRTAASKSQPEYKIQVERNLVLVRVVVRDAQGRMVRDLTKDDFQLFDSGKLQVISQFSTEGQAAPSEVTPPAPAQPSAITLQAPATKAGQTIPQNFVALYFDDLAMGAGDILRTRQAAEQYLASLAPDQIVAVFTSSGEVNQSFTPDRPPLRAALLRLQPRSRVSTGVPECPDLSDDEAYRIAVEHDQQALAAAAEKVQICGSAGAGVRATGRFQVRGGDHNVDRALDAAWRRWGRMEQQAIDTLRGLEQVVAFAANLPGRRTVLFISPGFISRTQSQRMNEIIDRALRGGVVVSAIDSRGLVANFPGGDLSQGGRGTASVQTTIREMISEEDAGRQNTDVLWAMASGTGGVFFENNNDLAAGFRQADGLDRFYYLLSFSPSDLRANGKFHKLEVKVAGGAAGSDYRIQARRGYYAPRPSREASAEPCRELQDLVMSRVELAGFPMRVETATVPVTEEKSQLHVEPLVDARALQFQERDGLYVDDVVFATAVFDARGNYVDGIQRTLHLRLTDTNLRELIEKGLTGEVSFLLPSGTYLLRQVLCEEGGRASTQNLTIKVP